ncbi:PPPDE putative peptidase domain [Trypanosoma melophagium]|uniref:PPPDE putative peptidase domain n=1 Tax=Trypanosoma melophagium TaxID=715481 RepID=UPI00351A8237|nr:PPPDE putative peptidase domain [Trypanosoma melophagium]
MSLRDLCSVVANIAENSNNDRRSRVPGEAFAALQNLLTPFRSNKNSRNVNGVVGANNETKLNDNNNNNDSNTTTTTAVMANTITHKLPENTVFLNVYDITEMNGVLYHAGIGVHHTGVEVHGLEYAFGRCAVGTGVFQTTPRQTEPHIFREQLILGRTELSREAVMELIENEFKANEHQWSGRAYHLVRNNCNNFSQAFAKRLLPPEVRAKQQREQHEKEKEEGNGVEVYDCGEREEERLTNGEVVMLPVLVPRWVNRLARNATRFLSEDLVDCMEMMDKEAQRVPSQE